MKLKKAIEECRKSGAFELELIDKGIKSPELNKCDFKQVLHIYRLSLAHNKISKLPATLRGFRNIEILNCCDNYISSIEDEVTALETLQILILGINCLTSLPPSIKYLQNLHILDLSYNFLREDKLPNELWMLENLRALYLSDNDLTLLPVGVRHLEKLEILNVRGNDIASLPSEIGLLSRLREFNCQGNRLTLLPPEFGELHFVGPTASLHLELNPWLPQLEKRMKQDTLVSFLEYLRSPDYRLSYDRFLAQLPTQPPQRRIDKVVKKKLSEHLPIQSKHHNE